MRKQYHFRESEKGLLAWDVHRLIELSFGLPVEQVPLSDIAELDETFWYGLEGDRPTCRSVALHAGLMERSTFPSHHPVQRRQGDGRHAQGVQCPHERS